MKNNKVVVQVQNELRKKLLKFFVKFLGNLIEHFIKHKPHFLRVSTKRQDHQTLIGFLNFCKI